MDTQEHEIKKSSSGRETHGVYMCHKCGWPFPKAHPSAKLRRAHKKVCGTIEGYKLFESDDDHVAAASDGEHEASEDQRTPSPVVDKRGVKELGNSSGIGLQSNRSADDVFSDAVAEFSDSAVSPAIEDHIKDLNKEMEKLVHIDSAEGKSFGGEAIAAIEGTLDNLIPPIQSIRTSNPEVDEHVINQSENANSSSEPRIEDSPVGSIGVTALQFDTSPVIFETPTDVLREGIDADVNDEHINSLNPDVQSTRESPEPYVNEMDKQTSYDVREKSLAPVADIEKRSKIEAKDNNFLDFVTQSDLDENDIFPLQKHLDTENSVTEFDGNKSGHQSEVQHVFEQSGEGKDIHVSLFKKKDEETTVSNLEEQKEADIAVYSLSVPDSLAGIANATHFIEDFKDYASPELSLPLELGSAEVIKYVGDDEQSAIAGQSVPGFCSVDSSGGINSSTTDQNTLKDNLIEKPLTDKSCISGSTEEGVKNRLSCSLNAQPEAARTEAQSVGIYGLSVWDHDWLQKPESEIGLTNESNITSRAWIENSEETTKHDGVGDPDQNKMRKFEESDKDIKQCHKPTIEDQLAANDKRTQGTDSLFLSEDDQMTSSLKLHQNQVLKEAAVELSEVCGTIEKCDGAVEKNTEGHESARQTQKSSDVDVQQSAFDSRGNMEQISDLSCKGANKLAQIGNGDVTDNTGSLASDVKSVGRNHNDGILLSSENQEAFIANELAPIPVGSEFLSHTSNIVDLTHTSQALKQYPGCGSECFQGKGDDKLETRYDGVSVSIASSNRADSMEGNWGSISVVSLQSDTSATADARGPLEKSQTALQIHKGAVESHSVKLNDFEPPSFITLVEPGNGVPQRATTSDISALSSQQQKDEDQKAAWFPSLSNVLNDSQGKKKNEREHAPLKSLLGEARSPNSKQPSSISQKDEISSKSSCAAVTTVDAILRAEPNDKDIEKEWDSPARYPVEIKKEKRKKKPYWVPFVCCSSVNRDF